MPPPSYCTARRGLRRSTLSISGLPSWWESDQQGGLPLNKVTITGGAGCRPKKWTDLLTLPVRWGRPTWLSDQASQLVVGSRPNRVAISGTGPWATRYSSLGRQLAFRGSNGHDWILWQDSLLASRAPVFREEMCGNCKIVGPRGYVFFSCNCGANANLPSPDSCPALDPRHDPWIDAPACPLCQRLGISPRLLDGSAAVAVEETPVICLSSRAPKAQQKVCALPSVAFKIRARPAQTFT